MLAIGLLFFRLSVSTTELRFSRSFVSGFEDPPRFVNIRESHLFMGFTSRSCDDTHRIRQSSF